MPLADSLHETISGVLEELRNDLSDGLWSIFQIIGINNIIDQVLHDLCNWRIGGDSIICGHKRSIIRILGSALPLKPVARPYLKFVVVQSISRSSSQMSSQMTIDSEMLTNDSYRTSTRQLCCRNDTLSNFGYEDQVDSICTRPSVPFPAVSPVRKADNDREATIKIAALESELHRLREQVTSMICQMANKPLTPPCTPVPDLDTSVSKPYLPTVIPPPTVSVVPPPPPPPPVIPPTKKQTSMKNMSQMILEKKSAINKHSKPIEISPPKNGNLSLTDVLKGLNTVKLKRIARSPGGTPLRIARSPDPSDPATIIAAALKKRFAKFKMESPERDGEISDFGSPVTPIRKSRRDSFSPRRNHKFPSKSPKDLRPALRKAAALPIVNTEAVTPPFGQHLLRRRSLKPERSPVSSSPSSDSSTLSR